ncbi:MAG TPA: hypothetical protein VN420_05850 [Candidatus Fimivivens sp.]|nr:hypothetical protein [Candidatus Fimivivens sp.]
MKKVILQAAFALVVCSIAMLGAGTLNAETKLTSIHQTSFGTADLAFQVDPGHKYQVLLLAGYGSAEGVRLDRLPGAQVHSSDAVVIPFAVPLSASRTEDESHIGTVFAIRPTLVDPAMNNAVVEKSGPIFLTVFDGKIRLATPTEIQVYDELVLR